MFQKMKNMTTFKKFNILAKLHAIYALQHHLRAVISLNSISFLQLKTWACLHLPHIYLFQQKHHNLLTSFNFLVYFVQVKLKVKKKIVEIGVPRGWGIMACVACDSDFPSLAATVLDSYPPPRPVETLVYDADLTFLHTK